MLLAGAGTLVLSIVLGITAYILLSGYVSGLQALLLLVICTLAGFAGPDQILNRRIQDRVGAIERDLPDIIDLLVISIYVKSVACVNRRLHYHQQAEITGDMLETMYPCTVEEACPVELVTHGHLPHRVLEHHKR